MFTTRPEILGTFGVVTSTHWLGIGRRHGDAGTGRQRFRRLRRRPASCCRSSSRISSVRRARCRRCSTRHRTRKIEVLCGQGTAPAARHDRALSRARGSTLIPGNGLLADRGSRRVRRLDAAVARPRHACALRDVLEPAIYYAEKGHPLLPRVSDHDHGPEDLLRDRMADLRRGLPARRRSPEARASCSAIRRSPKPGSASCARRKASGRDREGEIEAARDAFYKGFVAEAIDRFVREHGGDGPERIAPPGRDRLPTTWRTGARATRRRSTYDYHGFRVNKIRPWGQGPVFLQTLALLKGFDLGAMGPASAALRPHRDRGDEARLRRSGGLLRRSRLRRRADGDAAFRRLFRRAPQTDRRARVARAAARPSRRLRASGRAHA